MRDWYLENSFESIIKLKFEINLLLTSVFLSSVSVYCCKHMIGLAIKLLSKQLANVPKEAISLPIDKVRASGRPCKAINLYACLQSVTNIKRNAIYSAVTEYQCGGG